MASTRISSLAAGAAVVGADLFPAVQTVGVGPVKVTATQLKTWTSASPTLVTPVLGVATGTSIALSGAALAGNVFAATGSGAVSGNWTVGTNLAVTGTTAFTSTISTGVKSTSATGGVGYATGAGGAVTQITSKATGVTLNAVTGAITMHAANLAATTYVSFTLTNSAIASTDILCIHYSSGGTANAYNVFVGSVGSGTAMITVYNTTGGGLAEAIVLSFAVIKGATS